MQNSGRYLENGNSKAYLRDMVAGHHCSQNGFESEGDRSNESLMGQDILLGLRLWCWRRQERRGKQTGRVSWKRYYWDIIQDSGREVRSNAYISE